MLFSLSRHRYTILALALAAEYRSSALTSSQPAAAPAVRAVPYALLAKQVAIELGYNTAGARLIEALHGFEISQDFLAGLMHECLHWIHLSVAHDSVSGSTLNEVFQFRPGDGSTFECVEALNTASLLNRLPLELLFAFSSVAGLIQMLVVLTEISENWKDLQRMGEIIKSHKAYCDREEETLERTLEASVSSPELSNAISHLTKAERRLYHTSTVGCALFFAVMYGAHAAKNQTAVRPDQAMELSDNIIDQLKAHTEDDPNRPSPRKFLEDFGKTRVDDLEQVLADFITAAESLKLDRVPFVGPTRHCVVFVLFICKDIVEGQAARLKGWGKILS